MILLEFESRIISEALNSRLEAFQESGEASWARERKEQTRE